MSAEQEMPEISREIWDRKYRLKAIDKTPIDQTVEDTWRRVAAALAAPEGEKAGYWAGQFYQAMEGFRFMPGGRIVAGAASGRRVTLQNCYVLGAIEDDLGSIFSHLREAALTMQQGGGIGYDFSTLRPKGALVAGVGADASGPLSFMDVWDTMCTTIMSAGERRGAMMAVMRVDHPEVEDFIAAKADPARLRHFNLSVLVTDNFMTAVKYGQHWNLVFGGKAYKTVDARELWDKIMRATYAYAEPGVIFIDRINRRNNLWYCEKINASNPCGEQLLPAYGNCLLGSINLAALVEYPFSRNAGIDGERLAWHVETAVRMLDNVIEVSNYPLPQQREEALAKRRIGLGVTGLADALIMKRLRYGSPEAAEWTGGILSVIENTAYRASAALATEKGAFPLYDQEKYLAGEHIKGLPAPVQKAIADHGMRNSHLMSIAPTGTISLFGCNVSSGIEPIFSLAPYRRKFLMPDGTREEREVADYAVRLWRELRGAEPLPDYCVDAQTLTPEDHLRMLATAQRYVDAGISKTINLPEDIAFERFKDVYLDAYAQDCKSCTTYRPNEVTGSILSTARAEPAPIHPTAAEDGVIRLTPPLPSPDELDGKRYRIRWPDSDHALYVIITDILEHGRKRPWEVFLISNEAEADEWRVALGRMISAVYRRGGDVAFVAAELKAISDKKGGAWLAGKRVPSLIAAIGDVIERHMRSTGFLAPPEEPALKAKALPLAVGDNLRPSGLQMRQCPKCGEAALIRIENCDQCTACSYSKCS